MNLPTDNQYLGDARYVQFKQYVYTFHENARLPILPPDLVNNIKKNCNIVVANRYLTAHNIEIFIDVIFKTIVGAPVAKFTEGQCRILCRMFYEMFMRNTLYNKRIVNCIIMSQLLIKLQWHQYLKCFTYDHVYLDDDFMLKTLNRMNVNNRFRVSPMINNNGDGNNLVGSRSRL
jgi:hypothetical protein